MTRETTVVWMPSNAAKSQRMIRRAEQLTEQKIRMKKLTDMGYGLTEVIGIMDGSLIMEDNTEVQDESVQDDDAEVEQVLQEHEEVIVENTEDNIWNFPRNLEVIRRLSERKDALSKQRDRMNKLVDAGYSSNDVTNIMQTYSDSSDDKPPPSAA